MKKIIVFTMLQVILLFSVIAWQFVIPKNEDQGKIRSGYWVANIPSSKGSNVVLVWDDGIFKFRIIRRSAFFRVFRTGEWFAFTLDDWRDRPTSW